MKTKSEFVPHERLISFSSDFVMEIDSLFKLDSTLFREIHSENFFDKTDTIQFNNDEIYISYLGLINTCGDYVGDIRFERDTIVLDLINMRDYVCTSLTCYRIRFRIKNKGNKKYNIEKR